MRVNKLLELHNYKTQLESAENLIFHLASIVEAKDAYEKGATKKLAEYGVYFAKHIGLDEKTIKDIYHGALLRSIGKIELDEQILSKPGPLTEDEFTKIKSYPEIGEKICSNIKSLKNVLPIIRYHKEQYASGGYDSGGILSVAQSGMIEPAVIYGTSALSLPNRKARPGGIPGI